MAGSLRDFTDIGGLFPMKTTEDSNHNNGRYLSFIAASKISHTMPFNSPVEQ